MKKERIFWGLFFILAAAAVISGKLDFFSGFSIMKLLAAVLLAACLIRSIISRSATGIIFTAAIAVIVFDTELGLESITPWPVLAAAILLSVGVNFIFPNRSRRMYHHIEDHVNFGPGVHTSAAGKDFDEYEFTETIDSSKGEYTTVFGSSIKYINSADLKRLKLTTVFGAMKVYFDNAVITEEATVKLETVFGGTELYIPRSWNVIIDTTSVFGGVSEKNQNESTGGPTLRITGEAVFGGVQIIYV